MADFAYSDSRHSVLSWRVPREARYAVFLWLGVALLLTLFTLSGAIGTDSAIPLNRWPGELARTYLNLLLVYAPIVALMSIAVRHAPQRSALRIPFLFGSLLIASLIGELFQYMNNDGCDCYDSLAVSIVITFLPSTLVTAAYEIYRRGLEADEAVREAQTNRAALETELNRARLQALRAQVEPHFLFNTLANLRRLYQDDAGAGRQMMDRLIEYLRRSQPSLQRERITLDEDARLISAYLELHRIRMGSRLRYELDFPPALLSLALPPMMLLTLVENAIKHGLAPLPEGGFLRISARQEDEVLHLEVADSGRGMVEGSGHGSGLANIRARLAALYGGRATLNLIPNRPRGVSALLRLPAEAAA